MSVFAVVFVVVASLPAALALHEAGHALAARALGARAVRVRLERRRGFFGVVVEADLEDRARPRPPAADPRAAAFFAAGPATSVLCGLALVAAARAGLPSSSSSWAVTQIGGAVSVLFGAATALGTDGARAVAALRGRARGAGRNDGGDVVR